MPGASARGAHSPGLASPPLQLRAQAEAPRPRRLGQESPAWLQGAEWQQTAPRGTHRHLWPDQRHCTCLLTLNIGSGRRRGHRACRAGAGQSAAESPSGGAAGPGPAPARPVKQGTPLHQASVCSQCPPPPCPCSPQPFRGLTASAGIWARGGASPGSSGVWDKYLPSECCLSPAGSAASPAPTQRTPTPPAHSFSGLATLMGAGLRASGPCGLGRGPGFLVASRALCPWERPFAL